MKWSNRKRTHKQTNTYVIANHSADKWQNNQQYFRTYDSKWFNMIKTKYLLGQAEKYNMHSSCSLLDIIWFV